jgi:hypothetical protein
MVAARGPQMTLTGLAQRVAQRRAVARREREDVDQTRLGGLTGQALIERLLARTIPSGHLHGRVVSQAVGVVLGGVTQRQAIDAFAQQFDQLIANQVLVTRIVQPLGQPLADAEPMIGLTQQDQAPVGCDPIITRLHLDRPVKTRLE